MQVLRCALEQNRERWTKSPQERLFAVEKLQYQETRRYRRIWFISSGLISGFRRHRALGTWAYLPGGAYSVFLLINFPQKDALKFPYRHQPRRRS
jgi:hypothetical protein